jgi:phosphoribosyl 1,2-cyclic phosphodiesterase
MLEFISHASSSAGNLYEVRDGYARLLIDCGVSWPQLKRALEHRVTQLDGVLLTHAHGDHSRAVRDVGRAGVNVYASRETIAALGVNGHRMHKVAADQAFTVGSWRVKPFEVPHDDEGTLGFLVEGISRQKLFFATDCAYLPVRWPADTRILAIECNWDPALLREAEAVHARRVLQSHMSLPRLLKSLAANDLSGVREIWLLHLSDDHSDEAAFKDAVERATGKVVKVAPRISEAA